MVGKRLFSSYRALSQKFFSSKLPQGDPPTHLQVIIILATDTHGKHGQN
jgi:hypothetical protein